MVQDYDFAEFGGSVDFFKIMLTAISPVIIILGFFIFWGIPSLIFKRIRTNFKRNLVVSLIVVLFLLYPTLTSLTFQLFKCYTFDQGSSRLQMDMNLECWGTTHLIFVLACGVPMLVFWVIGIPIVSLIHLIIWRKRLNEPSFQSKYIVLYQGLRNKVFFWEIINTLRKILVLVLNIAIPASQSFYKAIAGVTFLVILHRLQIKLRPYQKHMVNELEQKEIVTSMITLYGATLFLQEDVYQGFKIMASAVIIVLNVYFYLFWFYCVLKGYEEKYKFVKKATFFCEHYL
jgi:hypothetical protein